MDTGLAVSSGKAMQEVTSGMMCSEPVPHLCPAPTRPEFPADADAPVFGPDKPWLAPLAGWSDLPFRLLCRAHGAAVCCTEMVSAKGLVYGSPGTADLLHTLPQDAPLVVQLFGSEASFMEEAVLRLRAAGFRWFDCNMGCSVPKVTRQGAGSAMYRDPKDLDNALKVAEVMLQAATAGTSGTSGTSGKDAPSGGVGFKFRLGWDNTDTWRPLATALADMGAAWLTLHPRTARQGFTGQARHEFLTELKSLVRVPVLASGDLFTAADGVQCLQETGVDGVMYARGALRDPAIFAAHNALLRGLPAPEPDADTLTARILQHAALARQYSSEKAALLKMRTIVPRYVRELSGARALRLAVIAAKNWDDFYAAIAAWNPHA